MPEAQVSVDTGSVIAANSLVTSATQSLAPALQATQKIAAGSALPRASERLAELQRPALTSVIRAKLVAFARRVVPKRSRKNAGTKLVQSEWSLDKIRVMRNDLTESDIEVVRTKGPGLKRTAGEPGVVTGPAAQWIKKTSALFRAPSASPFAKTGSIAENLEEAEKNRSVLVEHS